MQADETREEKIRKLRVQLDKLNRAAVRTKTPPGDQLSRDLRRTLKHQPTPCGSSQVPETAVSNLKPVVYQRNLPRETHSPSHGYSAEPPGHVALESSVKGRVVAHRTGNAFLVETRVSDIDETPNVDAMFNTRMGTPGENLLERLRRQHDAPTYLPADFIFADIETTGLGSSPLFLIGIMVWENDSLVVRQYLARTYAEEAAVIALFMDECRERRMIVTFNGKTFDYPYIRNRAAATGVPVPALLPHFDLLHECRRLWKHTLPDCKLQTLERYVCNRMRYGDIPGHMIPQAYHDYVRTENAWQIVEVLKHNMIDIVTLGELIGRWPKE